MENKTAYVQSIFDTGGLVPYGTYPVGPLKMRSRRIVRLAPGVRLTALDVLFPERDDCLISFDDVNDSKLIAVNAEIVGQLMNPLSGEWRHLLMFRAATRCGVVGGRWSNGWGDGCWIGPSWDARKQPCSLISVDGSSFISTYRNGISIVSALDVLISRCKVWGPEGTNPQAGIDIEAAHPSNVLHNIRVDNCRVESPMGAGLMVAAKFLNASSKGMNVSVQNTEVVKARTHAIQINAAGEASPAGRVTFETLTMKETIGCGVRVHTPAKPNFDVYFTGSNSWSGVTDVPVKVTGGVPFNPVNFTGGCQVRMKHNEETPYIPISSAVMVTRPQETMPMTAAVDEDLAETVHARMPADVLSAWDGNQ